MKRINFHFLAKMALCLPLLLGFGCASFELTSEPSAAIYENDQKIGTTPFSFNMMAGGRTFSLRRPGYVEVDLFVSSLDPKRQHINLQWVGRTRIDTLPRGARVTRLEDGTEIGITPCGLRLGRPESVKIELEGFEPVERDLKPNGEYVVELKPLAGFKSAFYKKIGFTSNQGRVEIYDRVVGRKIGTTPVQLDLEAGSELEYRLPGYRSRNELISQSAPHRIIIELEKIAQITIHGPDGAQVYRAGGIERLGQVPYSVKVEHDTVFELKAEGYRDRTVAVSPNSLAELRFEMEKIPYKTITTEPAGADIYRLGGLEKLGQSPFTTVVESERIFEIKKKGFQHKVVGMGPNSPEKLQVSLASEQRDDPDAAAIGELDDPNSKVF